jgi:aerobic carbon-monoxide dehydrogenase small subunit
MKTSVTLTLNGRAVTRDTETRETLAELIREACGLTATHLGCEHGVCGACTVDMNGDTTRSCLVLAPMANGSKVTTLEGFAADPVMGVLKEQFHENHALQCGFCTPGMLITARDILTRHKAPDAGLVRIELSGQLCRCTGYANIVKAIVAAGKALATGPG